MTKALTKSVVLFTIFALVLYNIAILVEPTPGDAISDIIHGWAERWATAPWAVGVLAGHWFWPWSPVLPKPWRYVALGTATVAVVLVDVFAGIGTSPLVVVGVGAVIGGLFWSLGDG